MNPYLQEYVHIQNLSEDELDKKQIKTRNQLTEIFELMVKVASDLVKHYDKNQHIHFNYLYFPIWKWNKAKTWQDFKEKGRTTLRSNLKKLVELTDTLNIHRTHLHFVLEELCYALREVKKYAVIKLRKDQTNPVIKSLVTIRTCFQNVLQKLEGEQPDIPDVDDLLILLRGAWSKLERKILENEVLIHHIAYRAGEQPLEIIRHMLGIRSKYEHSSGYETNLKNLKKQIYDMHEMGYTYQDFLKGKERDKLQLAREIEQTRPTFSHPESVWQFVEKEFESLVAKDTDELLETVEAWAGELGITWEEFQQDVSKESKAGKARLLSSQPTTEEWVARTYLRSSDAVKKQVRDIFREYEEGEMQKRLLLNAIPRLVVRGIDFTQLLYGTNLYNATALFNVNRFKPGFQTLVRKAFEEARQDLIREFLDFVRQIVLMNLGLSYDAFMNGLADISFLTEPQQERFRTLFERVQEYKDYSSIQKSMRNIFNAQG